MRLRRPSSIPSIVCVFLVTLACGAPLATADGPSFLRLFGRQKVEADPSKEYLLTEVEGPWLILAQTFTGTQGRDRAKQLVLELRREYNLPAFIYVEDFDFTNPVGTQGVNGKSLRYANATRYEAYAVLVGEFDSVDHPEVSDTLATLKTIEPGVFKSVTPESEAGPMAAIRRIHQQLTAASPKNTRGPMYNAFVTRNPMLPESFTQAPEVDSFVRKLNENVEHSLLDCEGNFTVVVRTFEGVSTTMIGGKTKAELTASSDRLDISAAMANRMVLALRKSGVEAYEFHDRTKSIVTIGSFPTLGRNAPHGFEYHPDIQQVMTTYRADERYGTDPGTGATVRYYNNIDKIPFDVQPRAIAVPRVTKRSLYSAALNL